MFNLMFNLMKQYKSTQSESPCSAESFTAQRRKDYVSDYSEITASPCLHQTVSVAATLTPVTTDTPNTTTGS